MGNDQSPEQLFSKTPADAKDGIVLVIYVDDCLIFTPKKERADNFIKEL